MVDRMTLNYVIEPARVNASCVTCREREITVDFGPVWGDIDSVVFSHKGIMVAISFGRVVMAGGSVTVKLDAMNPTTVVYSGYTYHGRV